MSLPRCLRLLPILALAATLLLSSRVDAASASASAVPTAAQADGPAPRQLTFSSGTVRVGPGDQRLATLALPPRWRYLQQADARFVVEDIEHNPPDPSTVGLIVIPGSASTSRSATTPAEEDSGLLEAIVSWDDSDGHIKDDDAGKIKYDELLKQMQQQARDDAPERRKQGFPGYELLPWAEPPHYDQARHILYWAESARFDNQEDLELNYKLRCLGARGVLEINFIDTTTHLPRVHAAAAALLPGFAFAPGNAYADFQPGKDKVAKYGIAGLIAGGALYGAAKLGFFGLIAKTLLPFIKWIIFGVIAIGGAIARFFRNLAGGRREELRPTPVERKPPPAA